MAKNTIASDVLLPHIPAVGPGAGERYGAVIGSTCTRIVKAYVCHQPGPARAISGRQQVLGYASMSTTAVYVQFNDNDLQDVYAKVPFCLTASGQ